MGRCREFDKRRDVGPAPDVGDEGGGVSPTVPDPPDQVVEPLLSTGAAPSPFRVRDAVVAGLRAVAAQLTPRRSDLVVREAIVAGSLELRERELAKLGSWSAKLEAALLGRGLSSPDAAVIAGSAVAALNAAARRWLAAPGVTLDDALDDALEALGGFARPLC